MKKKLIRTINWQLTCLYDKVYNIPIIADLLEYLRYEIFYPEPEEDELTLY